MTDKNFTHIYTTKELAELVTKHDEEYPDHGSNCSCENGLIPTLRIYFMPVEPIVKAVEPYVPPEIKREQPKPLRDEDTRKPWLARQGNETNKEYNWRVLHSCYNCGTVIVQEEALARHEDRCSSRGKQQQTN